VGVVAVPDERLAVLSQLNSSAATVPTTVEFVDIAGLVKGASKGEGLGNKCAATPRAVATWQIPSQRRSGITTSPRVMRNDSMPTIAARRRAVLLNAMQHAQVLGEHPRV